MALLFSLTLGAGDTQTSPAKKNPEATKHKTADKDPAGKKSSPLKVSELMKKQKQEIVFRAAYGNGTRQLGCVIPQEAMPEGPMSFAIDNSGNSFILDQLNKRVQVFRKNGKHLRAIPIPNQFISDIDIGRSGNLFLLDGYGTKSVLLIDRKGRILKKLG
jgi:hypothetical protein